MIIFEKKGVISTSNDFWYKDICTKHVLKKKNLHNRNQIDSNLGESELKICTCTRFVKKVILTLFLKNNYLISTEIKGTLNDRIINIG